MKKLTNIILEETIQESVEDIAKAMVFLEWLENQTRELIQFGDQTYNDRLEKYANDIKSSIEAAATKITNLSKDVKIDLFTRGGSIKEAIGIGLGEPAKDLISQASTAKSNLSDPRLEYLVDLHLKYYGIHWIIWEYIKGDSNIKEMADIAKNSESINTDWMYDVNVMANTLYEYYEFLGR